MAENNLEYYMKTIDEFVVRRLAFIKYLFYLATEQSKSVMPMKSASILLLQDSIELFAQLVTEWIDIKTHAKTNFDEYWDLIDEKLNPYQFPQRESMKRLNKARVALKHHGTFPSEFDIAGFIYNARDFFIEATENIFSTNFDEISMVEFIKIESVAKLLKEALKFQKEKDCKKAIGNIAIAFDTLNEIYTENKEIGWRSAFSFGEDFQFTNSFFIRLSADNIQLKDFIDKTTETINAMQNSMRLLALNIDYRNYIRFKRVTPEVMNLQGGKVDLLWNSYRPKDENEEIENIKFSLEFVIETCLRFQEVDSADIKHKIEERSHLTSR